MKKYNPNDQAYPTPASPNEPIFENDAGFTKKELIMKDVFCAIIAGMGPIKGAHFPQIYKTVAARTHFAYCELAKILNEPFTTL